ncbi:MAG: type II toxin-antitoxin system VapC family toxin [Prolixibacteraceae bacterium]|nr:type II toxin-antitoxin system VapC family toxin [Prolixibacteraceae bacterium]MBN2650310.1 type II toxin-antitoxin system VapC family toxin [Prolixibacteraceae bacterium]
MEHSGMVIDTSIFIEFLRAKNKKKTTLFNISETKQLYISSVTLYELYMGATSSEKKHDIQILTEDIPVLPFDDSVAKEASEIYHRLRLDNKIIEFRDIFIAATALVHELPINTLNKKHFERINKLSMI